MINIRKPGIRSISHEQNVAANEWVITHSFTLSPMFAVDAMIDVDGVRQTALPQDVIFPDANTIIIKWSQPHTGSARLG